MSEAKFLELLKENQGIIFKLVGLYATDNEEKKDLYQEVLLNAWKSWPSYKGEAKFSTWLYRLCLNTIFTQKRKSRPIEYSDSLEHIAPSVENIAIKQADSQRLWQAIRLLSEADRAIISMNLDGFDNAEIGQTMGITLNHVSVKLHRIKDQLAKLLKN